MKIYHKFLLYQNKLLKPYVRILLGLVEALTYLASLLLIVGVVYEHGFPLSPVEVQQIQIFRFQRLFCSRVQRRHWLVHHISLNVVPVMWNFFFR